MDQRQPGTGFRRIGMLVAVLGLCLALAGCLLTPGNFTSSLDIRRAGDFTFHYTGEIRVLGLVELARLQEQHSAQVDAFAPHCWARGTAAPAAPGAAATPQSKPAPTATMTRSCTDAEIAEQRKQWEDMKKTREDSNRRQIEQLSALVGGVDLNSPAAAEEIASRLRRQQGWRRVDYKGAGLYDVDFAVSGRLTHDFVFPTVEKMPGAAPFVAVYRQADGTVRMDAPAFAGSATNPAFNLFAALTKMNGPGATAEPDHLPETNGRFTLTTDAAILANNTDDGPSPDPAGQRLAWTITPRTAAAPTALLRLAMGTQ